MRRCAYLISAIRWIGPANRQHQASNNSACQDNHVLTDHAKHADQRQTYTKATITGCHAALTDLHSQLVAVGGPSCTGFPECSRSAMESCHAEFAFPTQPHPALHRAGLPSPAFDRVQPATSENLADVLLVSFGATATGLLSFEAQQLVEKACLASSHIKAHVCRQKSSKHSST